MIKSGNSTKLFLLFYALYMKWKDFSINIFLLLNTITNFGYCMSLYHHHGILLKNVFLNANIRFLLTTK